MLLQPTCLGSVRAAAKSSTSKLQSELLQAPEAVHHCRNA